MTGKTHAQAAVRRKQILEEINQLIDKTPNAIRQIAKRHGMSHAYVRQIATSSGISIRRPPRKPLARTDSRFSVSQSLSLAKCLAVIQFRIDKPESTLDAAGKEIGYTRERVRQILEAAKSFDFCAASRLTTA